MSIDEIAHGVVQILRALVFHTDLRWHGIRCRRPRAGCPSAIHHLMARSPSPKGWISLLMADVEHVFFAIAIVLGGCVGIIASQIIIIIVKGRTGFPPW